MMRKQSTGQPVEPIIETRTLTYTYYALTYCAEQADFVRQDGLDTIRFVEGRLHINDVPVFDPYRGTNMISWSQQTRGHFTSGHLYIHRGGTELHGMVFLGTTAEDAVRHDFTASGIPTVTYKTQITKKRYAADTDPSQIPHSEWEAGLDFYMSYKSGPHGLFPIEFLGGDNQNYNITDYCTYKINPRTNATELVLNMGSESSVWCEFNSGPTSGVMDFDLDQRLPTFVGPVYETCADSSYKKGDPVYFWKGQAQAENSYHSDFSARDIDESDVQETTGLTIAELMSIVPDAQVQTQANNMLTENMKWAMGQSSTEKKWLHEFLGENTPVISADRQKLVSQSLSWYQDDFSKAFLGSSINKYSGPHEPSTHLSDSQALKLKYYLQTGMAKDKDYNIQSNGIFLQAFIEAQPKLQQYIEAEPSDNWAQQLYATITSPPQLILMINRVTGAGGAHGNITPANNFATLLSALNTGLKEEKEYAQDYMKAVLKAVFTNKVTDLTLGDKDSIMEWLPSWLNAFLQKVADGGVSQDAISAAQQIKDLEKAMAGNIDTVASALADFLAAAEGANLLEKSENAENAFTKKWPKFAKVGKMLFFAGWCMGVIMVIKAFQNWKNLDTQQKVEAITSAVELGFSALDVVPEMLNGVRDMGFAGFNKLKSFVSSSEALDQVEDIASNINEDWVSKGAQELYELAEGTPGEWDLDGSFWEVIFEDASKVVAVVGIAASAVFAVLQTWAFVNDIKSGQPITKDVFDGILAASSIATTICLAVDLLVETTLFAMAAAVLAVVGVIVAIIEMFVIKPPNPLEEFMKKTVVPFVSQLPPQKAPPSAVLAMPQATPA